MQIGEEEEQRGIRRRRTEATTTSFHQANEFGSCEGGKGREEMGAGRTDGRSPSQDWGVE